MRSANEGLTLIICGAMFLNGTLLSGRVLAADRDVDPPLEEYMSAQRSLEFDTPEQAIEAFKSTVGGGDFDKLAQPRTGRRKSQIK